MPCKIGPYNRILDFGKTHFILERVQHENSPLNEMQFTDCQRTIFLFVPIL